MKKAVVVAVLALASCSAMDTYLEDHMTQQELEAYDAWVRALEDQEERVEDLEREIVDLARQIKIEAREGDSEGVRLGLVELDMKQQQHAQLVREFEDIRQRADDMLKAEVDPAVRGILAVLDPVVPIPLQPLVPIASSLAVMLLSKRSRKHTVKGLKAAAKGNLGEMLGFVLKAVGASHSSQTTQQVSDLEETGKHVVVQSEAEKAP